MAYLFILYFTILCTLLKLSSPFKQIIRTNVPSKRFSKNRVIMSWEESLGIKISGVTINNFDGLRGIVATQDLDEKSAVVTVDSKVVLETINNRPPSPFPDLCPQSIWEESMWDNRLAFMLMNERFILGQSSSKNAWIAELPKEFSTPFYWNEKALFETQYDEISNRVKKQRTEWRAFYDKWMSSISSDQVKKISFNDFVWALECVNSRAFSGTYEGSTFTERRALILFTVFLATIWPLTGLGTLEQSGSAAVVVALSILARDVFSSKISGLKRYVICPFVDMFNHRSDCISDVSYNYFSGQLELRTQPYKKGEQVFISYGKQSNDRLLQYYGFVEKFNPLDSYDFGVNILELLLKYGDALAEGGLLPSEPSPDVRLQAVAKILRATTVQEPAVPGRRSKVIRADEAHSRCFRASTTTTTATATSGTAAAVQTILSDAKARRLAQESAVEGGAGVTEGSGTNILSKFDDVTVRAVRAVLCSTEEWKSITGDTFSLESLSAPLSPNTELTVSNALRKMLKLELESKPTSIAEDMNILAKTMTNDKKELGVIDPSGSYSDPLVAAVSFRVEKKLLLLEVLQA